MESKLNVYVVSSSKYIDLSEGLMLDVIDKFCSLYFI